VCPPLYICCLNKEVYNEAVNDNISSASLKRLKWKKIFPQPENFLMNPGVLTIFGFKANYL